MTTNTWLVAALAGTAGWVVGMVTLRYWLERRRASAEALRVLRPPPPWIPPPIVKCKLCGDPVVWFLTLTGTVAVDAETVFGLADATLDITRHRMHTDTCAGASKS